MPPPYGGMKRSPKIDRPPPRLRATRRPANGLLPALARFRRLPNALLRASRRFRGPRNDLVRAFLRGMMTPDRQGHPITTPIAHPRRRGCGALTAQRQRSVAIADRHHHGDASPGRQWRSMAIIPSITPITSPAPRSLHRRPLEGILLQDRLGDATGRPQRGIDRDFDAIAVWPGPAGRRRGEGERSAPFWGRSFDRLARLGYSVRISQSFAVFQVSGVSAVAEQGD